MRFTAGAVLPVGDFLAHAAEWTGLPHAELLGLLRGSSKVSSGGSDEMDRLKTAFAGNAAARALLASDGDPAELLAKLRSLGGEAGAAALRLPRPGRQSPHRRLRHRRALGARAAGRAAQGDPHRRVRRPAGGLWTSTPARRKSAPSFPRRTRGEFDALLGEARLTYRLRDERGVYSDVWASGLMRRAALAAGRRVAGRGRIASPQQMLEAGLDEMCALVAGRDGPSAEELASRAAHRARYTAKDVPPRARPARAAAARPRLAAACRRPPDARDRHRAGTRLRQLADAERGEDSLRPRGQQGHLRRAGAPRLRPVGVRPHRQGRRADHRVRRPRPSTSCCRCWAPSSPTTAACSRTRRSSRASTAFPASSAPARRPSASPMACACASTAMRAK